MSKKLEAARARIKGALSQMAMNNRSGASELVGGAARVFSLLAALEPEGFRFTTNDARLLVIETCLGLLKAQPDMAPVANLASEVARAASLSSSGAEVFKISARISEEFARQAAQSVADTATRIVDFIEDGSSVLTHSRSSTVEQAFIKAARDKKRFSVIATESRPMLEGRALVKRLASEGIQVTLIADMAASSAIERVEAVLIGADKITPDHLVNKIGTRMIALAAREANRPLYSACDTTKFISTAIPSIFWRENPGDEELWPDAPPGVIIANPYFEQTPLSHFSGIITEEGALTPGEASLRAQACPLDQTLIAALIARSST